MSDSIKKFEETISDKSVQEVSYVNIKDDFRIVNEEQKNIMLGDSYHSKEVEEKWISKKPYQEGKKETEGKLNYELDWDFIKAMAERMASNKDKYEPYNWKKPIEIEEIKQALFRHTLDVMKGNYEDDGRKLGHLEAIAINCMILNFHLNG